MSVTIVWKILNSKDINATSIECYDVWIIAEQSLFLAPINVYQYTYR